MIVSGLGKTTILHNRDVQIPEHELSTESFKEFNYDDYIEAQKTLIRRTSLVTEHYLEELFPDLEPSFCGGDVCNTPVYEIVNSAAGVQEIVKMPTILLIGGIHGMETLGISLLINLIRMAQKFYTKSNVWFRILNNVRLLVIPAIDMRTLYYTQYPELKMADFIYVDPFQDFSFYPKKDCFQSFVSQAIYKIYNENLIYSTLVFTKKNFEIRGPRVSEVSGTTMVIPDRLYNDMVRKELMDIYNNHVTEESIKLKNIDKQINIDTTKVYGTFLEWSFGASENSNLATNQCIKNKPKFISMYKVANENSNRAFTIEVGFDRNEIQGNVEDHLGNELAMIYPKHPQAKNGIISKGLHLIRQFIETSRPFASLMKIEGHFQESESIDQEKFFVNLFFEIKGCNEYSGHTIFDTNLNELVTMDINAFQSKALYNTKNTQLSLKVILDHSKDIDTSKPMDFGINFECMENAREKLKVAGEYQSHLLRSQLIPEYNVSSNGQVIPEINLEQYQVKNVIFDEMEEQLIYECSHTNSTIYYMDTLMINLGGFFPLMLNYNKEAKEATLELVKHNIDEEVKMPPKPSHLIETGIVNKQRQYYSNLKLLETLHSLRMGWDIKLSVFNTYMRFICSSMLISKIQDKHQEIFDVKNSEQKVYKEKVEYQNRRSNGPTTVELTKDEKLNQLENNDPCFHFDDMHQANRKENLYFIQFEEGKPVRMVESMFIYFIGKYLRVEFTAESEKKTDDKNLLKEAKQRTQTEHFSLNGAVVLVDEEITGDLNNTAVVPQIPDNFELLKMEPMHNHFPFKNGSSCTSVFPVFSVTDKDLTRFSDTVLDSHSFERNFYGLYITMDRESPDMANITFYLASNYNFDRVILTNKSDQFELKKMNKVFEFEGDYIDYRAEIVTYQGEFELKDVMMNSEFITVFDPSLKIRIFDCFLHDNPKFMNLKNIYKVYKDIELATNEFISEEHSASTGIFVSICLVLLLCLIIAAFVSVKIYNIKNYSDLKQKLFSGQSKNETKNDQPLAPSE